MRKEKQIVFKTDNRPGVCGEVTTAIAERGCNIWAFNALGIGQEGIFCLVTDNNTKAMEAIKELGYKPELKDCFVTELKNNKGTLANLTNQLGDEHINIDYCYGSCFSGPTANLVVCVNNSTKAEKIFK
jgi:hypothetical protein